MKNTLSIAALLIATAGGAYAAPAAEVTQLMGAATATHVTRTPRVLAQQSTLQAGETLETGRSTYARVRLADGSEAVVGPNTRLTLRRNAVPGPEGNDTVLVLAVGQLLMSGAPGARGASSLDMGGTTIAAGAGSFSVTYVPDPRATAAAAVAQRAYASAALAVAAGVLSDSAPPGPVWEQVATTFVPQYVAPSAGPVAPPRPAGGMAPGLYVAVIDGAIIMNNSGGSQNFSAGQFGFVRNVSTPPVMVPVNPALKFTPPPVFSTAAPGSNPLTGNKAATVDCEVR